MIAVIHWLFLIIMLSEQFLCSTLDLMFQQLEAANWKVVTEMLFRVEVLHFEIIELWRFSGNILAILKKIIGNTVPRQKNVTR